MRLRAFLENLISKLTFADFRERKELPVVLAKQRNIDPWLKLRVYDLLKKLKKNSRKSFGMIVVLGWTKEWDRDYAAVLDNTQDIFREQQLDLAIEDKKMILEVLQRTIDFDGAILITPEGKIISSGIYLENMRPKELIVSEENKSIDLSVAWGFATKVHTRHLTAIAASKRLKGTTVFTVSEEDDSLRIFENGRIIWSTVYEEIFSKENQ